MAWFTEQIISDFLNRCEDHSIATEVLRDTFADDIVMTFGTQKYVGKDNVIKNLEEKSVAISSDCGFFALPVIIVGVNDPINGLTEDKEYKAVALHSKLEEYISWYLFIKGNEKFQIQSISASRGMGYQYYEDYYVKQEYKR